jgi:two-component system cell cycle sensor histidine kinase/response regulator CckA
MAPNNPEDPGLDQFRLFVESVKDYAIFLLDPDGIIVSWNAGAEWIKGYKADEIIGKHFSCFYTAADLQHGKPEQELELATAEGRVEDEGWRVRKDGTQFWANVIITAIRDEAGALTGFGKVTRDLTERKQAEVELRAGRDELERRVEGRTAELVQAHELLRVHEERLRHMIEGVKDHAIFTLDTEGRVTSWNTGAEHIYGYASDEIIGQHRSRFFTPEDITNGLPMSELRVTVETGRFSEQGWRVRKDGSRFWANGTMTVLYDEAGNLRGFVKIVRDLTERQQIEIELRASEERFRAFMDHTPAQVWIDDEDGVNRFANAALARELRLPVEEIIGRPIAELLPDTHRPEYLDSDRRVIESGKFIQTIVSAPRHDGEEGRFLVHKFPLKPSADGRRQVGGVALDVTERERTVEALRASDERFRLLIDGVKDYAIYMLDAIGTIETWNAGAARLYSYSADEIVGQHRTRLFTTEDVASGLPYRELELAAASGKASEEGWRVRKDGSRFWANGTMYALYNEAGVVRGFVKVVRDLTERKRAEAELRIRENRFRSLVTAMSQIVWTTDAIGDNYVATPPWAEYTGLPDSEVREWGWMKAVHPDDRERAKGQWMHSLETMERFETDYRILRADGEWRHFIVRGVPLLNDDGTVLEWVGVCEDDTVRRQAEEGMRLRDQAIQAVSQGILITDPTLTDNPIIYASRGFEGITGYTNDRVLGRNCRFLQGQDTDPATVRVMHEAVLAGRECAVEVLNYKQDGTPFWNALFMTPVRDDEGKLVHFVGVQADVIERRGLERALQQSQKMEAVGRLAGGVAHDFNNLLTVISGYSDLLLTEMAPTNPHRGFVLEILRAGERAAGLTRQLLAFSRKQVIQPVILDLNDVVAQTEKMLRRLLGEDIAIAAILNPALPLVEADPGQVDQVVMNLCVNARDAMPTGGRLTIKTNEFVLDEEQSDYPDLMPGRYAQLSVIDTGHGMTESVKAQIFEPFFTTKEPGKGTGLGLATVFGIVKQSNGRISVHSEAGVGTTFTILFPAVDDTLPSSTDKPPSHPLQGTETILLVEDEEEVRRIARISLETQGYKVLEAVGGTEAIAKAEQHPGPIHLVLTDVVMPEMGGRQLADTLRVRYPGVKVLFMSGYTDDAVIRYGITEQTSNFIQKPFAPLGLAKKVRDILDENECLAAKS